MSNEGIKFAVSDCSENGNNAPEFKFDLYSGFGDGPKISFELPEKCRPKNYDGAGIFTFMLEDLLKTAVYQHIRFDHGEKTHEITEILRRYADILDAEVSGFGKCQEIIGTIKNHRKERANQIDEYTESAQSRTSPTT